MTLRGRALAIAAGYALALAAGAGAVALRHRGANPAAVEAAGGMWAFGDLLAFLAAAGIVALPATYGLARALRESERAGVIISWTLLLWASAAPLAAPLALVASMHCMRGSPAPLLDAAATLGFLRILATPASLVLHLLGKVACPRPAPRRRVSWALALEVLGPVGLALGFIVISMRRC